MSFAKCTCFAGNIYVTGELILWGVRIPLVMITTLLCCFSLCYEPFVCLRCNIKHVSLPPS